MRTEIQCLTCFVGWPWGLPPRCANFTVRLLRQPMHQLRLLHVHQFQLLPLTQLRSAKIQRQQPSTLSTLNKGNHRGLNTCCRLAGFQHAVCVRIKLLVCSETCGACTDLCIDSMNATFFVNHVTQYCNCAWLAVRPNGRWECVTLVTTLLKVAKRAATAVERMLF